MKDKEKKENKWEKGTRIGTMDNIIPILKSLLLLVEEDKKRTVAKIEETKKILEVMKQRRGQRK